MKFNMNQEVKNFKGESLKLDKDKNWVVKDAVLLAVLNYDQEKKAEGKEKYDLYKLASKCDREGLVELTVEDVNKIKDLVGKVFSPVMVGSLWDFLENPEPTKLTPVEGEKKA